MNLELDAPQFFLASSAGFFSKIQCGKTHAPYKLFSSADIIDSISMSYCFPPLFYAAVSITFDLVFHIMFLLSMSPPIPKSAGDQRRASE